MSRYANLEDRIKNYIGSVDGLEKKRYSRILAYLEDDEFMALLDRDSIRNIEHMNNYGQPIEYIKQSQPQFSDYLEDVYFKYLSYLNDKKKNISYFDSAVKELQKNIDSANASINKIDETAKLISGASILSEYAKDFDIAAGEYSNNADDWKKRLYWSIFGLAALVACLLFFQITELPLLKNLIADDLKGAGVSVAIALAVKSAIVFGYLQIPLFFKRNFSAEKHLQQSYLHRRNILKSLHAVYNTIEDPVEKDKLITTGAAIAFSEPETGYITRKEGAGDSDSTAQILSSIWNKK